MLYGIGGQVSQRIIIGYFRARRAMSMARACSTMFFKAGAAGGWLSVASSNPATSIMADIEIPFASQKFRHPAADSADILALITSLPADSFVMPLKASVS